MWEFMSGVSPFYDRAHDLQLSLSICKGERPEITKNAPECYVNLMKKCWDSDPLKRPTASKVRSIIIEWRECTSKYYKTYYGLNIDHEMIKENIDEIIDENEWDESFENDIKEFWKADKALVQGYSDNSTEIETSNNPVRQSHPQAYCTSRLLDFSKKLNEILDQDDKEIFDYKDDQNIELHETGIIYIFFM